MTARPAYLTLVHVAPRASPRADTPGLTADDLAELAAWMYRRHLHGYRGVEIEPGGTSGQPHDDRYAVVYEPGSSWAAWGIAREADAVVVWKPATGKERGRYRDVSEAVGDLPIVWRRLSRPRDEAIPLQRRSNVVRLA